jgi:hypothetical protein
MPLWMWLNIPLMVLVIAAVVGIPYWLVLKHPDQDAPTLRRSARTARTPATAGTSATAGTPVNMPAQARYEQRVPAVNGERYGENYAESYGQDRVPAENGAREYDYSNR